MDPLREFMIAYVQNLRPEQSYHCPFQSDLTHYKLLANAFMACGHDTARLVAAIRRVEADIEELKRATVGLRRAFDKDTFPALNAEEIINTH